MCSILSTLGVQNVCGDNKNRYFPESTAIPSDCRTHGKVAQGVSSVGENDLTVAIFADGIGGDEINRCTRCLMRIINERLWKHFVDEVGFHCMGWADEDDCRTPV